MNKYFECKQNECFGCEEGKCRVLTAPCGKKKCPFFKTKSQVEQNLKESDIKVNGVKFNENYNPVDEAYSVTYNILNSLSPDNQMFSKDIRKVLCLLGQALA